MTGLNFRESVPYILGMRTPRNTLNINRLPPATDPRVRKLKAGTKLLLEVTLEGTHSNGASDRVTVKIPGYAGVVVTALAEPFLDAVKKQ